MSATSLIQSLKIQGQTSGDAAIATKVITWHADGYFRFADANGQPRSFQPSGDIGQLFKELFNTGAGPSAAVFS